MRSRRFYHFVVVVAFSQRLVRDICCSVQQESLDATAQTRDVNEPKLPVSSLGLGSIGLGLCAIRLLNEPFVDMKLYSIIKRYILANILVKMLGSLINAACIYIYIYIYIML
jgi:hypothetical protein